MLPFMPPPADDLSWLLEGQDEPLALGPELPADYRPRPRPKKTETLAAASDLLADHQLRLCQSWEMAEVYDGDRPGYFREDREDIADGVMELLPLDTLRQMYDFRCGLIAMHEPYPRLIARDPNDRDEAMAVEALVTYDFQCEERQHAAACGSMLRSEEAAHLQRCGMLVGLDTLNPDDDLTGLDMRLLDPSTVLPVWSGAAGLTEVFRVYEDDARAIAGNYGGPPGTDEYARIERAMQRMGSGEKKDRQHQHTVTEYWNGDWQSVIIDENRELFTRKHEYPGKLPFTIVAGAFDMPFGASARTSRPTSMVDTDWGEVRVSDRSIDIARKLRPYDWTRLKTHRIAEAVAGRQLSAFKWAIDPAMIQQYDPSQKHLKADQPRIRPGETIDVPLPNTLTVVSPLVDPLTMNGVNMALQANAQSGVLAQLQSGLIPPQTSGSALNAMLELGGASDTALIRIIQLFKRLRAEWRLELRRDYGGMLGRPRDRGVLRIPAARGKNGSTPFHAVTPAMIRRTGAQLEIELHHFRPDVGLAQYLSTLRAPGATGLPLITDETARRKLKITPDPDREGERVKREQLDTLPAILHQHTVMQLEDELDMALDEGDDRSAENAMLSIAELEFLHDRMIMTGEAAGGSVAPPGAGPTMAGMEESGGGPQLPGTSLSEQGIPVGTQGGAPTQAQPPVPAPPGAAMTPLTPGPVR